MPGPWTDTDIGVLSLRLHTYTLQLLMSKGLVSTADVQNMADQLYSKAAAQPETEGLNALTRLVFKDIPGVTLE